MNMNWSNDPKLCGRSASITGNRGVQRCLAVCVLMLTFCVAVSAPAQTPTPTPSGPALTIEMITWKQLQQHRKPVVLVDINHYWRPFLELVQGVVDGGYGHHGINDLFSVVDDVDKVFDALAAAPEPDIEVLTSHL